MKRVTFVFVILIFCFMIFQRSIYAMDDNLLVRELSYQEINEFVSAVGFKMISRESQNSTIKCFDVNEDSWIAIGCSDSEQNSVLVYDQSNEFRYGYQFNCYGGFLLDYVKEYLRIYIVRSDIALVVDEVGEIKEAYEILNFPENYDNPLYPKERKKKEIAGKIYEMKTSEGLMGKIDSSYTRVVTKNIDGEEVLVYSIHKNYITAKVGLSIGILFFVIFGIIIAIKKYRH